MKQFFPSVPHVEVCRAMENVGIPRFMVAYLGELIQCPSAFPEMGVMWSEKGSIKKLSPMELVIHEKEPEFNNRLHDRGVAMGLGISPLLAVLVLHECLDELINGVKRVLNVEVEPVLYADDGLLIWDSMQLADKLGTIDYSKQVLASFLQICGERGLAINLDKSGWVKKNGN